jgi:tripartite-type tricarboxylate transporter receptor subunit TctC
MIRQSRSIIWITLVLALWSSAALAQTPYSAGKTITIVAGTKAGDVYDLYARMFAQFMPKYIPGNPMSSFKTWPAPAR